jgi:hypothetical protein
MRRLPIVLIIMCLGWLVAAGPSGAASSAGAAQTTRSAPEIAQWPTRAALTAGADNGPVKGQMTYHGGPVLGTANVYVDFWGWSGDPDGEQAYLTNFLNRVAHTPWLQTVEQYGSTDAPVYAGVWDDPSPAPQDPTGQQFADEVLAAATTFGLNTNAGSILNDIIYIALPNGSSINGTASDACSYHTYAILNGSTDVPYVAFPYLPTFDANSCGQGNVTSSEDDGISIVAGHELAESLTDPLLNAWYQKNLSGEVADKCAWYNLASADMVGAMYPVQPLWSNSAGLCDLAHKAGLDSWPPQKSIPSQATASSPSVSFQDGVAYVAFKGHTSGAIYVQPVTASGWGSRGQVTGAQTDLGPALTTFAGGTGTLVAAWTDAATGKVETAQSANGSSWSSLGTVDAGNGSSSAGPALCDQGNDMFAAYKGHTSDDIYISEFINGSGWQPQVRISGQSTDHQPAVACDPSTGDETVFWTTSSDSIDYATFNGSSFGGVATVPSAGTDAGLAASASPTGVVTVGWKGHTTDGVFYSSLISGTWAAQVSLPKALTNIGYGLAWADEEANDTTGDTLFADWMGQSSAGSVWYSASNRP